jgi:hypothetical protein
MVFDLLIGIIFGIVEFVIALFGDITGHTVDFSLVFEGLSQLSWFVPSTVINAAIASLVFWVGAFSIYAPIKFIIDKIPNVNG